MQEQFWIALLRRIPAAFHDGLILATATGADVVLQGIVRLEEACIILRGRPAGTNEAGRIIVLPYEQINYISLPGRPNDQQVQAIFGDRELAFARLPDVLPPVTAAEGSTVGVDDPALDANDGEAAIAAEAPTHEPAQPVQATRAQLLAKLRAKLAGGGPKSNFPPSANPRSMSP